MPKALDRWRDVEQGSCNAGLYAVSNWGEDARESEGLHGVDGFSIVTRPSIRGSGTQHVTNNLGKELPWLVSQYQVCR